MSSTGTLFITAQAAAHKTRARDGARNVARSGRVLGLWRWDARPRNSLRWRGGRAEDAAAETGDGGSDDGAADAGKDAVQERDARRCDVFIGVEYGAPCVGREPWCE
jgi:hypothetical protein